jgi:hypothetical protein
MSLLVSRAVDYNYNGAWPFSLVTDACRCHLVLQGWPQQQQEQQRLQQPVAALASPSNIGSLNQPFPAWLVPY